MNNDVGNEESDLFRIGDDWKVKLGVRMLKEGFKRKAYLLFYDALRGNQNFAFARKNLSTLSLSHLILTNHHSNIHLPEDQIVLWLSWMFSKVLRLHLVKKNHGSLTLQNFILQEENKLSVLGGSKHFGFGCDENFLAPGGECCDVWALGCVLLSLCTNESPNPVDLYAGKIPDISINYTKKLHLLLKSMLRKDPKDRPTINFLNTKLIIWVTFGNSFAFGIKNKLAVFGKPYENYV